MSPYVKVTSFPHYPNTLRQVMTNYQPPPVWMTLKCTRSRRDMDSLPVPRAVRVAPEQHLKSLSRRVQAEILLQGPYLPRPHSSSFVLQNHCHYLYIFILD